MTEKYTPEKVAELVAEAREWPRDGVIEEAAKAIWATRYPESRRKAGPWVPTP